jgi:hypothetical protein
MEPGILSLSTTQILAYELASREISHVLDAAAGEVWRAYGDDSLIGMLAEEARWAAFFLHDRIAGHAVREGKASACPIASRGLGFGELDAPRPNRLRAASAAPEHLEAAAHRKLVAELSTCNAALSGIASGYAWAFPPAHAVTAALRALEVWLDALRTELVQHRAPVVPGSEVDAPREPTASGARGVRLTTADP